MAADLCIAGIVDGGLRDGRIGGVLRHQVDRAAQAGAGRADAAEEGIGTTEHLDPAKPFDRHQLARRDAEQAVVADVVAGELEAAHDEGLGEIAEAIAAAHAGIVGEHIGDGAGLLVLDRFGGIGGDAERHVHHVLVAEQAQAAATCHLAAGIWRRRLAGVAAGADGHGGKLGHSGGNRALAGLRHGHGRQCQCDRGGERMQGHARGMAATAAPVAQVEMGMHGETPETLDDRKRVAALRRRQRQEIGSGRHRQPANRRAPASAATPTPATPGSIRCTRRGT
ncbi:hypothetical protein D9M68_431970 [compost metagenome]